VLEPANQFYGDRHGSVRDPRPREPAPPTLAARWYYRLYSSAMKTAISLPDELSAAIDACARELKMTRSGLLAQAAREFVARRRRDPDPTEAWNRVIDRGGQPGDDPAARAFRRRTKAVVRASGRGRR